MTTIGIAAHYELDGIFCNSEVVGKSLPFSRAHYNCRIDLPKPDENFEFAFVTVAGPDDPRSYHPTTHLLRHSDNLYELRVIRIVVNTDAPLSAVSYSAEDSDQRLAHDTLLHELEAFTRQVAIDFCNWIRLDKNQIAMEPPGRRFPALVSDVRLHDIDNQRIFPHMVAPAGPIRVLPDDILLTSGDLSDLAEQLKKPGSPKPSWQLFLHAKYLAVQAPDNGAADRAIVLAVVAAETEIKFTLRQLASNDQEALVELLISNPRDWSMSLHSLFAVLLRSLTDVDIAEHRRLSRELQRAIEHRNAIVHRGHQYAPEDARDDVAVVDRVLLFLASVAAGGTKQA